MDRTIVVESSLAGGNNVSNQYGGMNGGAQPLDEGSLLVFQMQESPQQKAMVIPIGKVLEVFGPISKPLYTIRLPAPPSTASKTPSSTSSAFVNKTKKQKKGGKKAELVATESIIPNETEQEDKSNVPSTAVVTKEEVVEPSKMAVGDSVMAEPIALEESENDGIDARNKAVDSIDNIVKEEEETSPEKKTEKEETPVKPDHWASNGKYTLFLKSHAHTLVYYVKDGAKLIDTHAVIQNSGKGCGTFMFVLIFSTHYLTNLSKSFSTRLF
jgi:rRNA processing protein Gar1